MANANNDEHPMLREGLERLRGKVAIITGANSGIGRATARLFAREGANVVCCDIQETMTPRVDQLITDEGGEATFLNVNVTVDGGPEEMMKTAMDRYGGADILYNNAGGGIRKQAHEHTDEEWNFIMDLNLNAIQRSVRAVVPHMLEKGSGNIVSTASTFGLVASANYPAYCATKAAVISLTRQMALDYGPKGVRVNCICPGATEDAALPRGIRRCRRCRPPPPSSASAWPTATRRCCGWRGPRRWPTASSSWCRTMPPSSPATRWWWTAARPSPCRDRRCTAGAAP